MLTPTAEQRSIIDRVVNEPSRAALIAERPGAGKSLLSVSIGLDLWARTVLIVGVKATGKQFADLIAMQSEGSIALAIIDASKPGQKAMADYLAGEAGWYFIGHEYLSAKDHVLIPQYDDYGDPVLDNKGKHVKKSKRLKTWEGVTPDLLIYDESHKGSTRYTRGNDTMRGLKADFRICMSGTPAANRFENLYGAVSFLWPDRNGQGDIADASFVRWKQKWCAMDSVYIPGGRAVSKVTGEKNPGEFVKHLPCYIRAESDILGDPPAPEKIELEITAEQRRVYDDLENDLLSWVKDHPLSVDWSITLQAYLRLVCLAEPSIDPDTGKIAFPIENRSSKANEAVYIALKRWEGESVLHVTHSQRYARFLTETLNRNGLSAAEYSGKVSQKERERIKQAFINGEIEHFVAVTKATALGLDGLQKVCCKILEHSVQVGDPTAEDQVVRRIWRQGNPRLDEYEHIRLVAEGTIETGLFANVDLQYRAQQASLRKSA